MKGYHRIRTALDPVMTGNRMPRIAIVGGGPAGSTCAARLAAGGCTVDLFEAHPTGEKPCGGGIPGATLREFPVLLDPVLPRRVVTRVLLQAPSGRTVEVPARDGIHIFSRRKMDSFLRAKAVEAGATVIETTVRDVARDTSGRWRLASDEGEHGGYDFLVGADGVRGIVRRLLVGRPPDSTLTLARYAYTAPASTIEEPDRSDIAVRISPRESLHPSMLGSPPPGSPTPGSHTPELPSGSRPEARIELHRGQEFGGARDLVLKFFRGSDGYAWIFPRHDHLSIGICATQGNASASSLERDLVSFMEGGYPEAAGRSGPVKGYFIPADPAPPHAEQGERWALIGDAGGFVDPITREGIAPAMRSAALLAESILTHSRHIEMTGTPPLSRHLQLAHAYRRGFFHEDFLEQMIRMAEGSRAIRCVLGDLFSGSQGYQGLKRRLILKALPAGVQMGLGALLGRGRSGSARSPAS
jgi:flavin-dependent dehydrogenase